MRSSRGSGGRDPRLAAGAGRVSEVQLGMKAAAGTENPTVIRRSARCPGVRWWRCRFCRQPLGLWRSPEEGGVDAVADRNSRGVRVQQNGWGVSLPVSKQQQH